MSTDFGFKPYVGNDPFVFISNESEESEVAAGYARYLRDNGINVYYDAALEPGEKWARSLIKTIALSNCVGVIVMASRRSLESRSVRHEVAKAHYARKTVLAVFIEDIASINEPMRTYLSQRHSVPAWRLAADEAMEKVLIGARNMVAGRKLPADAFTDKEALEKEERRAREEAEAEAIVALEWRVLSPDSVELAGVNPNKGLAKNLVIPSPVENRAVCSIGDHVFWKCGSLASVTIPGSVTSIGKDAFKDCSSLASISIPDSVTSIGAYTFERCSSLTSIAIPGSVMSIGDYSFWKCSSLTSITIPDSVTSIGVCAFTWCSSLTSVTIPKSVTSIGEYAFRGCSSLTSITIPESVTSIGESAFRGCSDLTIYSTGGASSYVKRYAKKHRINYRQI